MLTVRLRQFFRGLSIEILLCTPVLLIVIVEDMTSVESDAEHYVDPCPMTCIRKRDLIIDDRVAPLVNGRRTVLLDAGQINSHFHEGTNLHAVFVLH